MCECKKTYFVQRDDGKRYPLIDDKVVAFAVKGALSEVYPERKFTLMWHINTERTGVEDE